MDHRRAPLPYLLAVGIGAALWFATSFISGHREAWDGSAYWALTYPLSMLACAFLGHSYPERAWLWALLLFEAQFVAMLVRNGEVGSLWPLGMVMFAILAVPGVLAATLGAWWKRRQL